MFLDFALYVIDATDDCAVQYDNDSRQAQSEWELT